MRSDFSLNVIMEAWPQATSFQVKSCAHSDCAIVVSCILV